MYIRSKSPLKPSAPSMISVAGNKDLVFCVSGEKEFLACWILKIIVSDKNLRPQRQKSLMFVSRTQQVFVTSDKNLRPQRQKSLMFVSRTQQVFVTSDKNLRPQRQKSLMLVSRTQQVFVTSDKNLRPQRQKSLMFVSRTQQVFVTSDKNLRQFPSFVLCNLDFGPRSLCEFRFNCFNILPAFQFIPNIRHH